MALTTIANTDTFNTWLNRTNQLVSGHNTYEIDIPNTYGTANGAYGTANGAYGQANTARTHANSAFANANVAYTHANSAFGAANAAFANGNTNFTTLQIAFGTANLAYTTSINVSGIGISAFGAANAAFIAANASFANGNTNFGTTVAAFAKANTALQNTTGTFAGTLTVTGDIVGKIASNSNTTVVRLATGSEFRTGTSRALALGVADVWDSAAEVSLTDGTSITMDMSTGFNFNVNLVSQTTRTLSTPSNMKIGQSGYIRIKQGGATAQTFSSYGTGWNFASGTSPTLSTGTGNTDLLFYQVLSSANVFGSLIKDIRVNY